MMGGTGGEGDMSRWDNARKRTGRGLEEGKDFNRVSKRCAM